MSSSAKKPDEIMADYLLGGAKMLADLCPRCKAPMFEVKGKRMCVVCADTESRTETAPVPESLRVITPKYAQEPPAASPVSGDIAARLDALVLQFCLRAEQEPDPARCLSYMECIRTAAEARTILNR